MGEVPLYMSSQGRLFEKVLFKKIEVLYLLLLLLQGYLAHENPLPPQGPPQVPRYRASVGSYGRGVSYERGTPVDMRLSRAVD